MNEKALFVETYDTRDISRFPLEIDISGLLSALKTRPDLFAPPAPARRSGDSAGKPQFDKMGQNDAEKQKAPHATG